MCADSAEIRVIKNSLFDVENSSRSSKVAAVYTPDPTDEGHRAFGTGAGSAVRGSRGRRSCSDRLSQQLYSAIVQLMLFATSIGRLRGSKCAARQRECRIEKEMESLPWHLEGPFVSIELY